jgi:peptidoglycan hydrolase CwlO-like protein
MADGITLAVSFVGLIIALFTIVVGGYELATSGKRTETKTKDKIDELADVLKRAGSEIEKLEKEVTSKSKKLQELDETSKRLDSLMSLKEKQVEAIRDELKATLTQSNRSNRAWTILIGAMWFILGLIIRGFLRF